MNTLACMSLVVTLMLSASCASTQTNPNEHAAHHPAASPSAASVPQARGEQKASAAVSKMQENMKSLQTLMAKIQDTKDPAERQKLMQQHMTSMHEQMVMMRGMGTGQMGMMGGGLMPKDQSAGKERGGMMGPDMTMMHEMMEQRMSMMQAMMDQMLQRQEVQEDSRAH